MGLRTVLHRFKLEPLRLKLDPIKIQITEPPKSNTSKYISFTLGTLLTISESLPFFKDVKPNGILDSFLKMF
jgi:hypothetical protein